MNEHQDVENVAESVEPEQTPQEKMLSQSEVNKIVGRAKAEAEQRARRELEEQYQREIENLQKTQQSRNESGSKEADADAIYQQVQERFNQDLQRQQLEREMSQIAQNYLAKVEQGRQSYQDFDDITKRFDPTKFPQLVYLVAGIENGGDVIYELAKNPTKLVTMNNLAKEVPEYAHDELLKLAASISTNRQAQQEAEQQDVNAPLDRLQPSRTTAGSNGKLSIRDLRNQPWLRG